MKKDLAYWREKLTSEQFHICFEKGTERPFTGQLLHNQATGVYACICCEAPLFRSEAKFDSGCGWPAFDQPITPDAVVYLEDKSLGKTRIEVQCAHCEAHLGHVFPDGPKETTGQRYCINSVCLDFDEKPS